VPPVWPLHLPDMSGLARDCRQRFWTVSPNLGGALPTVSDWMGKNYQGSALPLSYGSELRHRLTRRRESCNRVSKASETTEHGGSIIEHLLSDYDRSEHQQNKVHGFSTLFHGSSRFVLQFRGVLCDDNFQEVLVLQAFLALWGIRLASLPRECSTTELRQPAF
jgi:hypothetical protein